MQGRPAASGHRLRKRRRQLQPGPAKRQTRRGPQDPDQAGLHESTCSRIHCLPVFPVFSVSPVFLMLGAHSPVENGGLATNSSVGSLLVFLSNRYAPIASFEGAKTVTFRRFAVILRWQAARRLDSPYNSDSARLNFVRLLPIS